MSPLELLICALLISISCYLSGSEIALFSLSRFQLRTFKERFRPQFRTIKRLLADPGGLLVTILVFNEIVNVSLSTLITHAASRSDWALRLSSSGRIPFWAASTFIGIIWSAPVIFVLCEMTPKVIGARVNFLIAGLSANSLSLIYDLAKPIRLLLKGMISRVARVASRRISPSLPAPEDVIRESDFLMMIEEGRREGAIQQSEFELIKNVFEFDDTTVKDVFTPIGQVQALIGTTTVKSALNAIRTQHFSRVPVLSQDKKAILGIVYTKDLLRTKLELGELSAPITSLMKKPFFVPSTMRLNTMFRRFKSQRTHMAVVQGEQGDALGVVTMTDVLDALFEDLFPDEDARAR